MRTLLEIFYCKINQQDILYHKEGVDISAEQTNPDIIINRIITDELHKTPDILQNEFIIHSTSWRYESPDTIILTYLVYSDYLNFEGFETRNIAMHEMEIASNQDPKMPRPEIITEKHVISHGIRHLHFLLTQEHSDRLKSMLCLASLQAIEHVGIAMAGEI